MMERCGECGFFEPINKKFCITQANEASQDLNIFVKQKLEIYDKIFSYIMLIGAMAIGIKFFDGNSVNQAASAFNALQYFLILAVPLVIAYCVVCKVRRKKIIEKFKAENPKYLAILEKMGI